MQSDEVYYSPGSTLAYSQIEPGHPHPFNLLLSNGLITEKEAGFSLDQQSLQELEKHLKDCSVCDLADWQLKIKHASKI